MTLRHASFFSGAGGTDLGFEAAGIETVSVSEIDPYASAVLAQRWPSVPNLGDIQRISAGEVPHADIWSGGFPCQDLSNAGRRRGFADGTRSSLAFTYLDLVESRRPRWVVMENVRGLLTSAHGRDFGRLISEMADLGYGVAWSVLHATDHGVPQRRARVFVVGSHASDRAAQVLHECDGCARHPAPHGSQTAITTSGTAHGAGGLSSGRLDTDQTADTTRDRAPDGMARPSHTGARLDARPDLIAFPAHLSMHPSRFDSQVDTLTNTSSGAPAVTAFTYQTQANGAITQGVAPTMVPSTGAIAVQSASVGTAEDDPMLPRGLDAHRYRCCGNGIVAPVAEWIGRRIVAVDAEWHRATGGRYGETA